MCVCVDRKSQIWSLVGRSTRFTIHLVEYANLQKTEFACFLNWFFSPFEVEYIRWVAELSLIRQNFWLTNFWFKNILEHSIQELSIKKF